MRNTRNCKVCEKEIIVEEVGRVRTQGTHLITEINSSEGSCFGITINGQIRKSGIWFCKECWNKILGDKL